MKLQALGRDGESHMGHPDNPILVGVGLGVERFNFDIT